MRRNIQSPELFLDKLELDRDTVDLIRTIVFDPDTKRARILPPASNQQANNNLPTHQSSKPFAGRAIRRLEPDPSPLVKEDEYSLNTVIGPDDRLRVTNTTTYPWSAVTKIYTQFPNGARYIGSGIMIGPYHMLTAGHVIHSSSDGGWVSSMNIVPAFDGNGDGAYSSSDNRYFGEANWSQIRTYTNWTIDRSYEHDWALVTLDRSIGDYTGWLGYEYWNSDSVYNGMTLNTAGYPGDRNNGEGMYYAYGPASFATANNIFYTNTMDTAGGQSGSGVWRIDGSNRYVNAIHAYGGPSYNFGTRINATKFNSIESWRSEDNIVRRPIDRPDLVDYDAWFNTRFASFSTSTILPGQAFTARSVIRNNGTAGAGAFAVSFYASTNNIISTLDYHMGSVTLSSLNPFDWSYATLSNSFPNIPSGSYYLGWIIDSTNSQSEFREDNNTGVLSSTFTVLPSQPTITLSVSPSTVSEDGTSNLVYTFTRSGSTSSALNNVNFRVGGTAIFNNDYTQIGASSFTGLTGRVNFAQGSSTASIIVDPLADNIVEPNETVSLTLASGTGYTVGTTSPVTGTITNDDGIIPRTISPTNSQYIGIPSGPGPGNPYPSSINVSGVTGTVTRVTATLRGAYHTFPDDLDILLVGPNGRKVLLMSDAGGSGDVNNGNLTFTDNAISYLSDGAQIFSGSYRPTNYGTGDTFPGIAGGFDSNLGVFNGISPNGNWSLYVVDDLSGDAGAIAQGWQLTINYA